MIRYNRTNENERGFSCMENKPIIIGVTGGSGSGKTSVSRAIYNRFPNHSIMMLEHDSYYKDQSGISFEERLKRITIIRLRLTQIY